MDFSYFNLRWLTQSLPPGLLYSIATLIPFSGLEHHEEYVNFNQQVNRPGCWILKWGLWIAVEQREDTEVSN